MAAKPSSWRRNAAWSRVLSSDLLAVSLGPAGPALPRWVACVETLPPSIRTSRLRSPVDLVERCVYLISMIMKIHAVNNLNVLAPALNLS